MWHSSKAHFEMMIEKYIGTRYACWLAHLDVAAVDGGTVVMFSKKNVLWSTYEPIEMGNFSLNQTLNLTVSFVHLSRIEHGNDVWGHMEYDIIEYGDGVWWSFCLWYSFKQCFELNIFKGIRCGCSYDFEYRNITVCMTGLCTIGHSQVYKGSVEDTYHKFAYIVRFEHTVYSNTYRPYWTWIFNKSKAEEERIQNRRKKEKSTTTKFYWCKAYRDDANKMHMRQRWRKSGPKGKHELRTRFAFQNIKHTRTLLHCIPLPYVYIHKIDKYENLQVTKWTENNMVAEAAKWTRMLELCFGIFVSIGEKGLFATYIYYDKTIWCWGGFFGALYIFKLKIFKWICKWNMEHIASKR